MKKGRENDHSKYKNWIDPNAVIPYEKNAKIHTDKQIKNIVNSIKRFGWQQDTVITADNRLVIGHGRRLAALQLGCEMPYHRIDKAADELTDKDIRELRIADNQINAETGWNWANLELEMGELDFEGFEFDSLLPASTGEGLDDLFAPAEEKPPKEPEQIQCPHCKMWFTPQ
jgi:ParB-like chromosome segregation protein Spo0J